MWVSIWASPTPAAERYDKGSLIAETTFKGGTFRINVSESISWLPFAMTIDSLDHLSALKPLCCRTSIDPGLEVVGVSSEFQTQPVHIGHWFSGDAKPLEPQRNDGKKKTVESRTGQWENWRQGEIWRKGLPLCSMSLLYTRLSECPACCSRQRSAGLAQLRAE